MNLVDAYNKKAAELTEKFTKLNDKINRQREVVALETAKLEEWEREYNKLRGSKLSWMDDIMEPLADALGKYFGMRGIAQGPIGLRSEVTIRVSSDPSDWMGTPYKLLVVTPEFSGEDDSISLFYDTGEVDRSKCLPGSLGELNNFHHVTAPLPDTIEEIAALMRDVTCEKPTRAEQLKKLAQFKED